MTNEQNEQGFREIGKKIRENPERLVLSRVPVQTQNRLKQMAQDEFSGDYGMALKSLIDLRELYVQSISRLEELEAEVGQLHRAISVLTSSIEEPRGNKTRRMMNGREIRVKSDE